MAYTLTYTLINNDTYSVSGYTGTPISVTIPATYGGKSVTSIGYQAFRNCNSLTSIEIPNSVTSISSLAFYNTGIYNNKDNWENGVLYIGNWLIQAKTTISGAYTIKEGTVGIADSAFEDCNSLTTVTIGNSVTTIGDYAFNNCDNLTSVTIGNGVTNIGDYVFSRCYNLTNVTIGNSVSRIGNYAFDYCNNLEKVYYLGDINSWAQITLINYGSNPLYYAEELYINNELVTTANITTATKISNYTFNNYDKLTSVTIGNSVTSIGLDAFSSCDSLTSITVDSSNTAYKSIDGVLYSKDGKTLIFYPAGKTAAVFTIPNSVTSIGWSAFKNCDNLTSIIIPNSVTSIGYEAFYNCNSLTSVTIGNSVTSIGGCAFSGCTNLTSVTIGNSVTRIGYDAFYNCNSLTSVTIGNSVTSIGNGAFSYCTNLNSINMISKVPANLASNPFTNIKSTAKFYCYSSALNSYKTATNWSSYKDKFVVDDIRLTFIASANAQKNYFASKDEIKTLQNKADIIYIDNKFTEIKNDLVRKIDLDDYATKDYAENCVDSAIAKVNNMFSLSDDGVLTINPILVTKTK